MSPTCLRCGARLDPTASKRPAKYCSGACRTAACRARKPQVPAQLRERDRWVSWRLVRRAGRTTKMPVQLTGDAASSTDPSTWSSWKSVSALQRRGFVVGEGIGCIDLDHCLVDGVPTAAAAAFLAQLPATYIEVSPSGDGLHVWGLMPEVRGRCRMVGELSVETYSRERYITVTGKPFPGAVARLADLSEFTA
ncbi:DNA primase [Nocardia cyriacigeorgica]|uniref:bifunctional DNA primase/polymerase n=1 Tax=Nocardia cyriacigeorgica TaxID=135487 RepID=UPI0013B8D735|nr:bifunctional DNA primase/polymerase [Nocardia cyriacigeorgica]NEW49347.1 DNA primase [Nocardia cyriacigeorgica]